MRYRDIFWSAFPGLLFLSLYYSGLLGQFGFHPTVKEINRDDANRVRTVLLSPNHWSEFHISPTAQGIRVMTNAALTSTELPEKNQSDPRDGWRYSIEYQLLDADGELIRQRVYESRTRLRKLVDADSDALIDPLMFGTTGQVATQTRFVQIPALPSARQPAVIRIRSTQSDPQISEIVARVRTKHERPHYENPATWRQISLTSRQKLAKFCVFDQKFLTPKERASLLRWHWIQAPTLNNVSFRHLYFIGEIDDQEATETIPSGKNTITASRKITLPMPELTGELRLSIERIKKSTTSKTPVYIAARLFPSDHSETILWEDVLKTDRREFVFDVRGGLIEFETTHDVTWSATWTHLDPNGETVDIEGQPVAYGQSAAMTSNNGNLRVYLADHVPVTYHVSHFGNQPTPFRITCRIAFGDAFASDQIQSLRRENEGAFEGWNDQKTLHWQWLDADNKIIDQGDVAIEPEISFYDQLWKTGEPHLVSEFKRFYFSIPPSVKKIRFDSQEMPFLLNASVRPNHLPVLTRLPEDRHPFQRQFNPHRKWFNVSPDQHLQLISDNRSFVISTQTRPRETDDSTSFTSQSFQWQRYEPNGQWIGRQLLAPATLESTITESNSKFSFFELKNNKTYALADYGLMAEPNFRLIYVNPNETQSELVVRQNDRIVQQNRLISSRGTIALKINPLIDNGTIRITGPDGIRLFFSGAQVVGGKRFLKRTASRLENGELEFQYEKQTNQNEVLTLLIYRKSSGQDRCKLSIKIESDDAIRLQKSGPVESLTALHQIYDLKSRRQQQSAILFGTDAELDVEHRCFIRLGPDLPVGRYKIKTKQLDENDDGFVLLYQSKPIITNTGVTQR